MYLAPLRKFIPHNVISLLLIHYLTLRIFCNSLQKHGTGFESIRPSRGTNFVDVQKTLYCTFFVFFFLQSCCKYLLGYSILNFGVGTGKNTISVSFSYFLDETYEPFQIFVHVVVSNTLSSITVSFFFFLWFWKEMKVMSNVF